VNKGLLKTIEINREKARTKWHYINSTGVMKCCRCKNIRRLNGFREIDRNKYEYKKYNSFCNFCDSKRTAVYKNKKIQTIDGKAGFLFNNISRRSKDKGWEIQFNREYIEELYNKQNGRCFYTDEPMNLGYHRDKKDLYSLNFHNISVDRINSKKGYTIENTVLCCWGINNMKQQLSVDELLYWAEKILSFKNRKKKEKN